MRIVFDLQGAQSDSKTRGIGRYSLNLARALATIATDHEIWILLSGGANPESVADIRATFEGLIPQERIRTFEIPGPVAPLNPDNVWAIRAAERIREHVIATLRPDAVLVGSLFEGGANEEGVVTSIGELTSGERTAAVLYDLIPYQDPHTYIHNLEARVHYARKIDSLLNAGLLLAISDYSRQEAIDVLGVDEHRIVSIGAAAAELFGPRERSDALLGDLGIQRPFILCCPSGFEPRKNVERLIEAVAALPAELRPDFQLVLASHIDDSTRVRLRKLVARHHLKQSDVIFTGRVDDETLLSLYASAALCVVPSLREGFGLPALEAMTCGAPVIGSITTSLPEAIGREDALFDPESVESMRDLIERVLVDEEFRASLVHHGREHARKFTWEITARKTLVALEEHFGAHEETTPLRIAVVGTPPEGARAAAHRNLSDVLEERHETDVYAATGQLPDAAAEYDHVLYHVTNETPIEVVRDWLALRPGVVVVHDPIAEADLPISGSWLSAATGVAVTDERVLQQLTEWFGPQSPRTLRFIEQEGPNRTAGQVAQDFVDFLSATNDAKDADLARLVDSIGALPELAEQPRRFPAVAAAIAESTAPSFRLRQLLIDLTVHVEHDAHTGVQRVVRAQLDALLRRPPPGITIQPAYFKGINGTPVLHYAHEFTSRFLDSGPSPVADDIAEVHAGDIYYALDLTHGAVLAAHQAGTYDRWRARGVRVAFLVYDLLPVQRPEFFVQVPNLTSAHRDWLLAVADSADLVICISKAVSHDLRAWLRANKHPRADTLEITYAHLGHDLPASKPTTGIPDDGMSVLARLSSKPSILMVGTVEPRKGYRQTVAGMDELWAEGLDANVVIVGKPGWDPELAEFLRTHPEIDKRLIWLSDISDEFLTQVYASCTGLLLASEGEGFGLPLVEAAQHGLPILARDLPVTREVAGDGATYFEGLAATDLADAIREWLPNAVSGRAPSSALIQDRTWAENAADVISHLVVETGRHD